MTPTRDSVLRTVLDRQAIQELMARYCAAVTRRDFPAVGACFTPDAFVDYEGVTATGTEDILAHIRGVARTQFSHFLLGNQLIDLHGDSADVETYVIVTLRASRDGKTGDDNALNRYSDRMVRRDGRWLIAHRAMVKDWRRLIPVPPA